MAVKMPNDPALIDEAIGVLLGHMEPAKVARFLAVWQTDGQNYLELRDQLFDDTKVDDLFKRLRQFEANR